MSERRTRRLRRRARLATWRGPSRSCNPAIHSANTCPNLSERNYEVSDMTTKSAHDSPILVTGAAGAVGAIGRNLTALLLTKGHKVRALVRREDERAEALRQLGAEVMRGDLTDLTAMHRAIEGCARVYFGMSVSADYLTATVNTAAVARAAVRPTAIPTAIALIFIAGGIESSEVFPNRMRCFRPGNRLVAREPLLLVHICLDQARINRERFATDKPSRDACRHHTLEHPAQGIALTKALMPRTA